MSQPPIRPFESLAWYRDAARHGFRDDGQQDDWAQWARGTGPLFTHISVFAVGMVLLFALNQFLDPGSNWASWWIVAWLMLLAIHVIAVTLLWMLQQWNADDLGEPLMVPVRNAPASWVLPPDPATVQDAEFWVPGAVDETTSESTWNPWQTVEPPPDVPEEERASWSEASAAAWLTRGTDQDKDDDSRPAQ